MSIGLKRGTVAVEPHRIEWDMAAQEVMNKLKDILQEDIAAYWKYFNKKYMCKAHY